jgi:hypothetical protein
LPFDGGHPFVRAAALVVAEHDSANLQRMVEALLCDYYETVRLSNAREAVGLSRGECPELEGKPYWALTMPWSVQSPEEQRKSMEHSVARETPGRTGGGGDLLDGWAHSGPVSSHKLQVEAQRIIRVTTSILRRGYVRSDKPDGDISVDLLLRDNVYCWQVLHGMHRSAALVALNYRYFPVRVLRSIRRSDVSVWPQVQSGLFTEIEALKVFDWVMSGAVPPSAKNWVAY